MKKILIFALCSLIFALGAKMFALTGLQEQSVENLYDIYRARYLEQLTTDLQIQKLTQTQTLLEQYARRPTIRPKLADQVGYLGLLLCHTRSLIAQELCINDYRPESLLTRSKDDLNIDEIRKLLSEEHSKRRVERKMSTLTLSSDLNTIAQKYALKLCEAKEITHTLNGSTLEDRYLDDGYDYVWGGENLAQGQRTIMETLDQLTTSIHHRENMYNPEFREIGIGQCNDIWVLNYGAR